jgi:hypothetical protein
MPVNDFMLSFRDGKSAPRRQQVNQRGRHADLFVRR